MPASREFRCMNRRVVGFRAAVGEERFLQLSGRDLMKLLSQVRLRLVAVERRSVGNRLDLVDDGFGYARIRVAHAHGQHAAETVEIFVALVVPNMRSFAAHQSQGLLVISGDRREEKLFVFANGFGRCGLCFSSAHFRSFALGIPRSLQIFSTSKSLISLCLGMADLLFCAGLCHQE